MKIAMAAEVDVVNDEVIWLAAYSESCGSQTLEVAVSDFPDAKEGDKFTVTIERAE